EDVIYLEKEMDHMEESLPQMTHFILPGGHPAVSYCHIARTVCRRAERMACLLHENQHIDAEVLSYMNRLSDYLFVLARAFTYDLGAEEVKWIPEKKG
ncbi:ATP:cob(I)alamin adenosyltransferase, partial [Muriicola sp.]|uniref:ATP:cob(I)alamin adenosyltransferase n=1 Tax=Muriicola sp. TaxID=2020856 RepID=UPI003569C8FE